MKILLTGATGFVGSALTSELLRYHYEVVAGVRKISTDLPNEIRQEAVGDFSSDTEWSVVLQGVDVVVHSAARVHVINENNVDSLSDYRKDNVDVTLNLARQAAAEGVRRFIFISSVKVNGEMTAYGHAFKPDDLAVNTDPYALSKYEAEQELMALSEITGMEIVIIRPPLIYGPGVRANFLALMKWVNKGIPLPFGAVHNKRSLLALDNLLDFVICCINHPKAANQIFLISDEEDVSTAELVQKVANALGKRLILLPVPINLMKLVAKLIGKEDIVTRLFGSLQVDNSKARELLGWKPVITMDDQLRKTVKAFLNDKNV